MQNVECKILKKLEGVFWGLGMAALYALTCQRSVGWQDSGKMQYRILIGDYSGWEGIALSHPLYIGMARAWVWLLEFAGWTRDVFWGMNLFNALGMGVAVALVWHAAVAVCGRREAGWAAAVLFGFAHMPWWMATIAESYAWAAAFHAGEWLLLALILKGRGLSSPCLQTQSRAGKPAPLCWGWVLLALVNGAHLSLENYALLNLPVYGCVWIWLRVKKCVPWWSLAPMALAWVLGALMWWMAVADSALTHASMLAPDMRSGPWWGFNTQALWHGIAGGVKDGLFGYSFQDMVLGKSVYGPQFWMNMGIFSFNFFNPLWIFAAWGVAKAARGGVWRRNGAGVAMAALLAFQFFFFIRYPVPDQGTHSTTPMAAMAILGGCGVAIALPQRRTWAMLAAGMIWPVFFYTLIAQSLDSMYAPGKIPKRARELPRNEMRYWALPWKAGERSAEHYAAAVRKHFEGRGDCVLLADATVSTTLLASQRAEGWDAPKVLGGPVISGLNPEETLRYYESLAEEGRLFVVSPVAGYAPAEVLGRMDFIPDGPVHRAVLKTFLKE